MRFAMKKNGFLLLYVTLAFSFVGNASFLSKSVVNPVRVIQVMFNLKKEESPKKIPEKREKEEVKEEVKDEVEPVIDQVMEEAPLGFQYIKKDGFQAFGYFKMGPDFYYFDENTGYCLMNQWKKVLLDGKNYLFYFGEIGRASCRERV